MRAFTAALVRSPDTSGRSATLRTDCVAISLAVNGDGECQVERSDFAEDLRQMPAPVIAGDFATGVRTGRASRIVGSFASGR
jgi:hypothetical protein